MIILQHMQGPARALARVGLLCAALFLVAAALGCAPSESSEEAGEAPETGAVETASKDSDEKSDKKDEDKKDGDQDGEKKQKKKPKERTTSVSAALAYEGDLVVPVIAEGTIRARHEGEIRTEIAGRLVRMQVDDGDAIRRGQLIARIDDREYQMAFQSAESEYLRALSVLAIEDEEVESLSRPPAIQAEIDELERMESRGEITAEDRLVREIAIDLKALRDGSFRGNIAAARSGVATARANMERARLDLEKTQIRAPYTGIVTARQVSSGELVTANQTVCTLVNNIDIEADVGVLESDIGKINVGHAALLAVPALKDTFRVEVDVISPQFDRDSRTAQVLLRLKNEEGRIRPGMFVRAIIAGEKFADRLIVPREAILTRDGRPLLFKVEDQRAKWLYVQLGEQNDDVVEVQRVLQGGTLGEGDAVIVSDHLTLAHDAKVKVKRTLPVRDPWAAE